jgi:glycosyltransferase involved in cell wall biosynthesis
VTQSVSVIIPNYNYGRFLKSTIDSVLNQSHKDIEVIVIDNGSTDNSRENLESYGDKVRTIFQENLGQSAARNAGLSVAEGSLIALLDADDYWETTKIERQLELLHEEGQFVFTAMRRFADISGQTLNVVTPVFRGDCRSAFVKFPSLAIVPGGESSALLTRHLVEKVGTFNPALNSASGRDYFRRCATHTKFDFVREAQVNVRIHDKNMSNNSLQMMNDTAKAYDALFSDPEWANFYSERKKCMRTLEWSYLKTNLKRRNIGQSLRNLSKMVNP